jgi:sulfate transport system ATP-binding protein
VGFVFQHYAAFKHLSVFRNVAFGLEIRKRPKDEIRTRVMELLELVHLEQFADRYPAQLSGGQRQRMALARALAVEPSVMLLDEPFGALDAQVRRELRDWLRRLHDEVHVTTVFVTHDQEEALEVSDEIVVINQGAVEQTGTPSALYDQPANEFVMRFLGPVTHLGGRLVRPHDIDISLTPEPATHAATVSRIQRVGFEVRVEARTGAPTDVVGDGDADEVSIQLTRGQADRLDLAVGQKLWLRASHDASALEVTETPALAIS